MIAGINIWAVLVAALAAFLLGGIWYAKPVFGAVWCQEAGVKIDNKKGHGIVAFILAFLLSFIAALVLALFLGPDYSIAFATGTGFAIGLFWVASSFGINYLFAGRSLKLFLIDGGYHVVQFTLYGFILGLWSSIFR